MKILYQAQATAIGGRDGSAATADKSLRIGFAIPAELGGQGGPGNNPEQLFAAGYAACFLDAIRRAAAESPTTLACDSNVTVTIGLVERTDDALATALMHSAHAICPYSLATRGNVPVHLGLA